MTTTTDDILRLHRECMHKLANEANEHALRTAVERLVAERDAAIAALGYVRKAAPTVVEPAGWFESPHGAFRANLLFRIKLPPQSLAWQIPLYVHPPRTPLTEAAVRRAARVLSDRTADACNIDREDEWKIYSDTHIEDARAALEAAASEGERND